MKERPIIFDAESVRGILAGAKTQTRRVVTPQPEPASDVCYLVDKMFFPNIKDELEMAYARIQFPDNIADVIETSERCPYGYQGDRLWVREAWYVQPELWQVDHGPQPVEYAECSPREQVEDYVLKPAMFMPRWASRITLEVAAVRVERLQEISDEDVRSEGLFMPERETTCYEGMWQDAFRSRWDAINAERGWPWAFNPWVWVVEFRLVQR